MIEKMTRYTFILMKEYDGDFLSALQDIGIVDITRSTRPVDDRSLELYTRAETLRRHIEAVEGGKYTRDAQYNTLTAEKSAALRELQDASAWGDYDPGALDTLEESGIRIRFYKVPAKKFDPSWAEIVPLQEVSRSGSWVWFVTAGAASDYQFPVAETLRPSESAAQIQRRIDDLDARLTSRMQELDAERDSLPGLRAEYLSTLDTLERYLAIEGSDNAAEGMLSVIEGFAPTADDERVKTALDALDVVYVSEEATTQDNPPIKLRNSRFARLFETITGMYGMPVYDEFDPTPVLSLFFMLFFAMCMGDAGYGIVLMLFGLAVNKKWIQISMFSSIGTLISVLGAATFLVGLVLGTFFGMDLSSAAWYPDALKHLIINGEIAGYSAQMVLALGIGVLHICLAMLIKTALYTRKSGFRESVSTWGWTLLIVGTVVTLSLSALLHLDSSLTRLIIIAIGAVSALGIFVFNKPGRNPLINVGAGLWDTYQMVTGLLGDVLSYIRLYALGLAGGMLGDSFNNLAQMVLGGHPTWQWLPFVLIVLFGHTLNLLMSCLGAFVHPLRLTFVEYFKNSGFEGTGRRYNPLVKIK